MSADPNESSPCFRVIGVWGDRSCPELATHVHCLRCPVFETAARDLFDRPAPADYREEWTRVLALEPTRVASDGDSHLVFRVGTEWLALPTKACVEVTSHHGAHALAHRKSPAFEGIVNVRGQLLLACSLRTLLGIPDAPSVAARALLLVADIDGGRWALVIDEVSTVRRIAARDTREVPATLEAAIAHHVRAIVEEGERTIGILDPNSLSSSLARCVA
jgi:chemotaxis-related protein WspD